MTKLAFAIAAGLYVIGYWGAFALGGWPGAGLLTFALAVRKS